MSEYLKAIAVDDEPGALSVIRHHVGHTSFLQLGAVFRDPVKAVEWIQQHPVDVIFLDINMPGLSGLKFRELVGSNPMIIFTTAYSKYALESYELKAVDYLLKPITFDRFLKAALKAKELWNYKQSQSPNSALQESFSTETHRQMYVKSGNKLYILDPDEILFFQKDGNYVIFYTVEKKILSRLNMRQIPGMVPSDTFLRVHKSYIVNLSRVEIVERHQLTIGPHKIPVAKSYRDLVMEKLKFR